MSRTYRNHPILNHYRSSDTVSRKNDGVVGDVGEPHGDTVWGQHRKRAAKQFAARADRRKTRQALRVDAFETGGAF